MRGFTMGALAGCLVLSACAKGTNVVGPSEPGSNLTVRLQSSLGGVTEPTIGSITVTGPVSAIVDTDDRGMARFPGVKSGLYTLVARPSFGFADKQIQVSVNGDTSTDVVADTQKYDEKFVSITVNGQTLKAGDTVQWSVSRKTRFDLVGLVSNIALPRLLLAAVLSPDQNLARIIVEPQMAVAPVGISQVTISIADWKPCEFVQDGPLGHYTDRCFDSIAVVELLVVDPDSGKTIDHKTFPFPLTLQRVE